MLPTSVFTILGIVSYWFDAKGDDDCDEEDEVPRQLADGRSRERGRTTTLITGSTVLAGHLVHGVFSSCRVRGVEERVDGRRIAGLSCPARTPRHGLGFARPVTRAALTASAAS